MRLSKRSKVVTGAIVIVLVLFVTLYLPDYSNISDRSVSDYEQQDFIRLKDTTRKTVEKTQSEDDLPTIDDPFAKEDPDSKTHFIIYGAGRSGTTWLSAFFRLVQFTTVLITMAQSTITHSTTVQSTTVQSTAVQSTMLFIVSQFKVPLFIVSQFKVPLFKVSQFKVPLFIT